MTYARLPEMSPQGPDEPIAYYGARIVRWLLAEGCTATLSDDQLALAEYAAMHASTARGYLAGTYGRLSSLRHEIAAALRRRTVEVLVEVPGPGPADRPNTGPMAPLNPAPVAYPPAGAYARPDGRADIPF